MTIVEWYRNKLQRVVLEKLDISTITPVPEYGDMLFDNCSDKGKLPLFAPIHISKC